MKKFIAISLVFVLLLLNAGCEKEASSTENSAVESIQTIPFDERKFLYHNGLVIEYKTEDNHYYPVIVGLKDNQLQERLNKEMKEAGQKLIPQLEMELSKLLGSDLIGYKEKETSTYIHYSYNNVLFFHSRATIGAEVKNRGDYYSNKFIYYGYDLNTGNKISLSDIFKPHSDYETKINNYISQYIIENNFDDYSTEKMIKPFEGIRENQNFTFAMEGLAINLDEQNEEFIKDGYMDQILIPMTYLGDDLAIFDRFFDPNKNIFKKEKLLKKLFPNKMSFKPIEYLEGGEDKFYYHITKGHFLNVPDSAIESRLNEMAKCTFDIEAFKEKSRKWSEANRNSYYSHSVDLHTNAGGYLSVSVNDEFSDGTTHQQWKEPFNYDFNLNKEVSIEDLFAKHVDFRKKFKDQIRDQINSQNKDQGSLLTEEHLDIGIEELIKTNKFYFSEEGITIYFSPKDVKLEDYQKWVYIPFDVFGWENIAFLN